ncbi:hypothetical protein LSAT2_014314, partial [Lamellibrachia satsuma]
VQVVPVFWDAKHDASLGKWTYPSKLTSAGCDNSISGDTWWRHVRTQTNQTPVALTSASAVSDVISSPLDIVQALVTVHKRYYPI